MSLETAEDARRAARLSRAEYDQLRSYLEQLPPEGWTEQSACDDWKVYQVVSHLSSGPEIGCLRLEAAIRGAQPPSQEQMQAIWGHFDSLGPEQMLPEFRRTNDEYFKLLDSLTDDELGRTVAWFTGPTPVATALAMRLNEQALHAWDIRWARRRQASLSPAAAPDLLDLHLLPGRLTGLTKPERAEQLAGKSIQFMLSQPERAVNLQLDADGPKVATGRMASSELTVELSTEAFLRLIWGRYDVAAGLKAGQIKLSRPDFAGSLEALFPGR